MECKGTKIIWINHYINPMFFLLILLFCCYRAAYALCIRQLRVVTTKCLVTTKRLFQPFYQIFCAFFGSTALQIGDIRERSAKMIQTI